MNKIRIGICDSEPMTLLGLEWQLTETKKCKISFAVNTTRELSAAFRSRVPDVLIAGKESAFANQLNLLIELKQKFPDVRIIVFARDCSHSELEMVKASGIEGLILKTCNSREIYDSVDYVMNKGFYYHHPGLQKHISQSREEEQKMEHWRSVVISGREEDVLLLLCAEWINKEIADELNIDERTVEFHRKNLFLKTGCKNLAGLAIFSFNMGWIKPMCLDLINIKNLNIPKIAPPGGFSSSEHWFI